MSGIHSLGHVGIFVEDLHAMTAFYRDELGLIVTDDSSDHGMVFFSARPEEEHHEIVLVRREGARKEDSRVQQISFRCESLHAVRSYYRRLVELGIRIDKVVSHGNAVGVYFYDPEGNRCEVYWDTGFKARQPFLADVDIEKADEELVSAVRQSVEQFGATGTVDGRHLRLK